VTNSSFRASSEVFVGHQASRRIIDCAHTRIEVNEAGLLRTSLSAPPMAVPSARGRAKVQYRPRIFMRANAVHHIGAHRNAARHVVIVWMIGPLVASASPSQGADPVVPERRLWVEPRRSAAEIRTAAFAPFPPLADASRAVQEGGNRTPSCSRTSLSLA
jgi:hypothetical protein